MTLNSIRNGRLPGVQRLSSAWEARCYSLRVRPRP
jgi:hypothetical protein